MRALNVARRDFLSRLFHQLGGQSPAHLHQLSVAFVRDRGIDGVGRANVEAGLHIGNRRRNGQAIQRLVAAMCNS